MAKRRKFDPDEELDPDELEELEAEGAFHSRGLLKDGHRTTIKMYMRDGSPNPYLSAAQRAIAAGKQTEDAAARRFGLTDGLQLHRPGFRRVTDAAALERTRQAYNDYDAADAVAYKQIKPTDYDEFTGNEPRNTGTGAPGKGSSAPAGAYPLSAGEGTACTVNGQPGVLVRQGNGLVCVPNKRQDAATFDSKAQAYADYDREMSNAWRGPNR